MKKYPFDWNTINDLQGIEIGILPGNTYTQLFWDAINAGKLKVQRVYKDEKNFRTLKGGRIAIMPQYEAVGYSQLREMYQNPVIVQQFTHHPKPLKKDYQYVVFSKQSKNGK